MPADPETVAAIINHLDTRLTAQDHKRSLEFKNIYDKLDVLKDTTSISFLNAAVKVAEIKTKLEEHMDNDDRRFQAIEDEKQSAKKDQEKKTDRTDGWLKTGIMVLFSSGAAAFINYVLGRGDD